MVSLGFSVCCSYWFKKKKVFLVFLTLHFVERNGCSEAKQKGKATGHCLEVQRTLSTVCLFRCCQCCERMPVRGHTSDLKCHRTSTQQMASTYRRVWKRRWITQRKLFWVSIAEAKLQVNRQHRNVNKQWQQALLSCRHLAQSSWGKASSLGCHGERPLWFHVPCFTHEEHHYFFSTLGHKTERARKKENWDTKQAWILQ